MPTKSAECFSISFHPTIEEWQECKELFKKNFLQLYRNDKYILTPEKGNKFEF